MVGKGAAEHELVGRRDRLGALGELDLEPRRLRAREKALVSSALRPVGSSATIRPSAAAPARYPRRPIERTAASHGPCDACQAPATSPAPSCARPGYPSWTQRAVAAHLDRPLRRESRWARGLTSMSALRMTSPVMASTEPAADEPMLGASAVEGASGARRRAERWRVRVEWTAVRAAEGDERGAAVRRAARRGASERRGMLR